MLLRRFGMLFEDMVFVVIHRGGAVMDRREDTK